MQHLRVTLQRREHLGEILHGFVVDELRVPGNLIDDAGIDLPHHLERHSQLCPKLL